MSLAKVYTQASVGLSAPLVSVEVHLSHGLPAFHLVGLPEAAVKESKERVRSAIINSGFEFPTERITINLAPADLPKQGGRFDLPIAIAILIATGQIQLSDTHKKLIHTLSLLGELSLTGELKPIRGALSAMVDLNKRYPKFSGLIPEANQTEATLINTPSYYAKHLLAVTAFLQGTDTLEQTTYQNHAADAKSISYPHDFAEVKGQAQAKRALEIAAVGKHNVLFCGPPGCGKSMLAERFNTLLPPMNNDEASEFYSICSISQQGINFEHLNARSFRSPHHSVSPAAMVGGGNPPQPGEVTLAHCGTLFLDELPEFPRSVLEALREPMESRHICISRVSQHIQYPANFQLIAAMNPCPCGYYLSEDKACRCTLEQIRRYQSKLSGPLLDRIDMHIQLQATPLNDILQVSLPAESSATIRQRIVSAQTFAQNARQQSCANAQIKAQQLISDGQIESAHIQMLEQQASRLNLSARGLEKVIRVARSIADLEQSASIQEAHLYEALSFRSQLMLNQTSPA